MNSSASSRDRCDGACENFARPGRSWCTPRYLYLYGGVKGSFSTPTVYDLSILSPFAIPQVRRCVRELREARPVLVHPLWGDGPVEWVRPDEGFHGNGWARIRLRTVAAAV